MSYKCYRKEIIRKGLLLLSKYWLAARDRLNSVYVLSD